MLKVRLAIPVAMAVAVTVYNALLPDYAVPREAYTGLVLGFLAYKFPLYFMLYRSLVPDNR